VKRGTVVLLGGAVVAVALGAGAALLKPSAPVPTNPPNLGIPVPATAGNIDPRVFHERLLEELVLDARDTERPDQLPSFDTFTLLVTRDPETFDWVVDRLAEPDVPDRLATAFAGHLPTRQASLDPVAHRLLAPRLQSEDPERVGLALEVLRASGRTRIATDPVCHCAFGHYPAEPEPGAPVWLLAFPLDPGGVAWELEEVRGDEPGWILHLRRSPDGRAAIAHRLERTPEGGWFLASQDGEGPRMVVE